MSKRQNGEYWKERFRQMEKAQNERSVEKAREIQEQFDRAVSELDKKMTVWYERLAENNDVSLAKAKRMLNKKELQEFRWSVEEYIRYGKENADTGQWVKELENASARVHIGWLEARKLEIRAEAERLYGKYADIAGAHISDTYTDNYYRTAYEIQKKIGLGSNIQKMDANVVEKIISKPWAVDGRNFSERIWQDKEKLVNTMHQSLSRMCITGAAPDKAVAEIAKVMNASKKRAWTLVMTESAVFSNKARQECMSGLDVEEYEVVETLDSHTCPMCGKMDGKHYSMDLFETGVTAPPFHPNCRGCTAPYFNDEFSAGGKRIARGEDGKTYHVPSDMTYEEWKKEYVGKSIEKSHESDTIKTKEISGALNPESARAKAHAERYYESVRKMKTDVKRIAENTGYPEKEIRRIKDFVFMTRHDLGNGELEYFAPSYEMAQSWQRLIDGRNIKEHDLTLLKHEMLEHELMSKGLAQNEAHDIVTRIYNYSEESDRYYAEIDKHKKDR